MNTISGIHKIWNGFTFRQIHEVCHAIGVNYSKIEFRQDVNSLSHWDYLPEQIQEKVRQHLLQIKTGK